MKFKFSLCIFAITTHVICISGQSNPPAFNLPDMGTLKEPDDSISYPVRSVSVPQSDPKNPPADQPQFYIPYSLNPYVGIPPQWPQNLYLPIPYYPSHIPPPQPYPNTAPVVNPHYHWPFYPAQPPILQGQHFPSPGIPPPQQTPMAPPELINFGFSTAAPCATISTMSNCILRVPDDGIPHDVQSRNFILGTGLIKDQCMLTVKDCSGRYTTSSEYLLPSSGSGCRAAATVCCECNGCNRASIPVYLDTCAILYENAKCSSCHGFAWRVTKNESLSLKDTFLDNTISSVYVVPGCELVMYKNANFEGDAAGVQGSIEFFPDEWNDDISSYLCVCKGENGFVTSVPPTAPSKSTTNSYLTTEEFKEPSINATTIPVPTTGIPVVPITSTKAPIVLTTSTHASEVPTTESPTGTTSTEPLTMSTTTTPKPSTTSIRTTTYFDAGLIEN